ncbi:MAG: hypothetical protein AB7K71_04310 [Polyangiaceae bacterium]
MRILPSFIAGVACALLTFSCSGADDGFTDGNEDPQRAECETKPLYHCFGVSCYEFYSGVAASAERAACADFGSGMQAGGCPAEYSDCCIDIEGYNDYPNGTCKTPGSSASLKSSCVTETSSEPKKWCGG